MPTAHGSSDDDSSTGGNAAENGPFDFKAGLTQLDEPDGDTLRILLSTDNHLGYEENDDVRGLDSFAAFEEVLYLAKRFSCDMVLLAGDLFHENRPSRRTLYKTMEILRRYTMGQDPVQIQILGDPQAINYLNPHISVDLPIFGIHGNHDDPTRDGGDLLAAMDLLHVNLLVNYFGRQTEVSQVQIAPVLIQKGTSRLALYGLGALREERLHRMWREGKVSFLRPEANNGEDASDNDNEDIEENEFFNIFALHQNRDVGRGSKNCVQETMIPDWMDVVVWGHEHECQIDFTESVLGTFRITQPGSSVATSLVAGEAVMKKVGIMDCRGKQFRLHTVPLTQIRPFVTNEIILAQHRDQLDPDDNHIDIKVTRALEEEVRLMILNAKEKQEDLFDEARIAGSNVMDVIAEQQRRYSDTKDHPVLRCTLVHPEKVLTRVRVEHSGFSTLNNQRFGAKFVDEIANSDNILLFHRKKSLAAGGASGPRGSKSAAARKMDKPMEPDELEGTHMEDLVRDFLEMPNQKLKLLEEKGLAEAMEAFVEKNTTNAIPENAKSQLIKKQKTLITNKQVEKTTDIQEAVEDESKDVSMSMSRDDDDDVGDDSALLDGDDENAALKRRKGAASKTTSRKSTSSRRSRTDDDDDDDDQVGDSMAVSLLDDEDDGVTPAKRRRAAPSGRAASKSRARAAAGRLDDDDDDVIEIDAPPKKARAAAGRSQRTATKKKVNYSVDSGDEDDEDGDGAFESRMDEDDDEEVLVVDEPVTKKKTARGRAAAPKKRAAPTRKTTSARSKRATSYLEEDDDGDFNGSGAPSLDDDWGSAATRSQL